ncbi:MAG: heme exporter protein CcmB [Actinobacteria bacterium]|nr:heme exporter protein CcmB [Actinomycetota bacterium]
MSSLRQIAAILKKDIISELRTKEMLTSMFLFVMLTMVIFNYAFGADRNNLTPFGGGMLWITFLFTAILGLNRSFVHEKDEGCLEGLLLAPVDRPVIYLGKMTGNLIFLSVIEIVTLPIFTVFFISHNYFPQIGWFIIALILSNLGISATGTLLATISINTKTRDMMLPILFLPIIIPLLIGAVVSTGQIMAGTKNFESVYSSLKFLGVYDIIFLLISYGLYDFVLGE